MKSIIPCLLVITSNMAFAKCHESMSQKISILNDNHFQDSLYADANPPKLCDEEKNEFSNHVKRIGKVTKAVALGLASFPYIAGDEISDSIRTESIGKRASILKMASDAVDSKVSCEEKKALALSNYGVKNWGANCIPTFYTPEFIKFVSKVVGETPTTDQLYLASEKLNEVNSSPDCNDGNFPSIREMKKAVLEI